jgi:antitoxin YobK
MTPRIEQLITEIESLGEVFEWAGPQTQQSVAILENSLGVRLPPSYRAFLLRYGAGGIRAYEGISGIYNDPLSMHLGTAYGDTTRMRTDRGMPSHLIVIERGDEHFPPMCLDTSRLGPDGEYPVVGFWLISQTVSTDSYANFAEYLEHSLATSLEVIQEEAM